MEKADKKDPNARSVVKPGVRAAVVSAVERATPMVAIADACFDIQSSENTGAEDIDRLVEALRRLLQATASSQLLGLLGKCQLPGCDVHFLTPQQDILRHVEETAATPPVFTYAREWWRSPHDGTVALLVYTDRMEALMIDGSVVPISTGTR